MWIKLDQKRYPNFPQDDGDVKEGAFEGRGTVQLGAVITYASAEGGRWKGGVKVGKFIVTQDGEVF